MPPIEQENHYDHMLVGSYHLCNILKKSRRTNGLRAIVGANITEGSLGATCGPGLKVTDIGRPGILFSKMGRSNN
jgi:hypothetical protein